MIIVLTVVVNEVFPSRLAGSCRERDRRTGETGEDHHRYQEDCQNWADGEWTIPLSTPQATGFLYTILHMNNASL